MSKYLEGSAAACPIIWLGCLLRAPYTPNTHTHFICLSYVLLCSTHVCTHIHDMLNLLSLKLGRNDGPMPADMVWIFCVEDSVPSAAKFTVRSRGDNGSEGFDFKNELVYFQIPGFMDFKQGILLSSDSPVSRLPQCGQLCF